MIKWDFVKKEKGVPHMLAPRRHCLDYSKVYRDVTKICLLAWDENKKIEYYIFYTNSKFSIDFLYNSTYLLPVNKHN